MNISLIGMMGSGKTTIGEILSQNLKYNFADTDSEIIKTENRPINQIFEEDGETYFRDIESKILSKVLDSDNQIISTGGGIIKSEKNIQLLKKKSVVFYLKANANELFERVKNNRERPLLNVENMKERIEILLKEREHKYEQANYIIDTCNKNIQDIVDEIIGKVNEYSRS